MNRAGSYQEKCLHDAKKKSRGESSVFYVRDPDNNEICRKEYKSNIDKEKLSLYHKLHNKLSEYKIEIDTNFKINKQHISKIIFSILPLGKDIIDICSIDTKENICISNVPYVDGDSFAKIAIKNEQIFHELYKARDIFREELTKKFGYFGSKAELNRQLGDINMKCIIKKNTMNIIVTDICAKIGDLYKLCDKTSLALIETLS